MNLLRIRTGEHSGSGVDAGLLQADSQHSTLLTIYLALHTATVSSRPMHLLGVLRLARFHFSQRQEGETPLSQAMSKQVALCPSQRPRTLRVYREVCGILEADSSAS